MPLGGEFDRDGSQTAPLGWARTIANKVGKPNESDELLPRRTQSGREDLREPLFRASFHGRFEENLGELADRRNTVQREGRAGDGAGGNWEATKAADESPRNGAQCSRGAEGRCASDLQMREVGGTFVMATIVRASSRSL